MITIDEIKCIKKAAKGDANAFATLVERYQTQIYQLCFRMTGNTEDAQDMTQEAFLKAWKGIETFRLEASFSTWLYRLASNCCLDLLRSMKRRPTVSLTVENEEEEEQTMEIADDAPSPEDTVIWKEEREHLQLAMMQLDDEQRQILTLRVVNGMSYTDIAELLDIKEGTVKSRLSRARENLRKNLAYIGNQKRFLSSYEQERRSGD